MKKIKDYLDIIYIYFYKCHVIKNNYYFKYFNKTRITFVLINITRIHKDEKKKKHEKNDRISFNHLN